MSDTQPIVTIEDGSLQGSVKVNWVGGQYYSFQGIPYARPPIGKLRFKAPQPVDSWTGIKDVTKEGSDSYSRNIITQLVGGSEDCLFLNVYTPELPRGNQQLKPVMVWIHGGAFIAGSGSTELYGPDFLVAEDVVIVTINYRVGLLGFACFSDPSLEIPGNAGLKDQVQALKWVQKNISKFCGDPNNVTIFGESAGGASVHMLMLSPLAKGLFHKAIAQSGAATGKWAEGQLTAPVVAKVIGIENASEAEIIRKLNEYPVEKIFEIQEKLPEPQSVTQKRSFGIVIESHNSKSAFLARDPQDIINSGNYNHVPFIIGYTSKEGMLFEFSHKLKYGEIKWPSDFEDFIPLDLHLSKGSDISKNTAEKIKQFYYGNETASPENIDQFYLMYTDLYFFLDINKAVRDHTKTSTCPIYYYRMSVDTRLNVFKHFCKINRPGASHGDDIGYLFKNFGTPEIRPKSPEYFSLIKFLKLWTTFAKYGNPNPVKQDCLINVTWLPTEHNKLHFLDIGENLTVGVNPESERVKLWDEIFSSRYPESKL